MALDFTQNFTHYHFLDTMLFIGNFTEGTDREIQVVDGQQRLTIITVLVSVLSSFLMLERPTLSKQIVTCIMTEDDDGNEVRILKSKTNYSFLRALFKKKRRK